MGELEEKEIPPTESTPPHQEVVEEPKETDRMLATENTASTDSTKNKTPSPTQKKKQQQQKNSSKPSSPTTQKAAGDANENNKKKTNGEEIIDIPDANAANADDAAANAANDDDKQLTKEGREVKPKKIPIGGIKMPGFFTKAKPRGDGDGAEGELLEKEQKDGSTAAAAANSQDENNKSSKKDGEKPRPCLGERIRNFFVRKPAAEKKQAAAAVAGAAAGSDDTKSEATVEAAAADGGDAVVATAEGPPQKRGLLNAIKLPIANMIPKKKTDDDVELGLNGPGTKAGLASMETLDDSLKDQDCVDKAPAKNNGTDDISKLKTSPSSGDIKQAEEKVPDEPPQHISFLDRIRAYRCSLDDGFITLGIILIVMLIAVIGYVLSFETLTSPPVREGRFMDAVTGCGMVEGLKEDGAFAFRGIPYAIPPVGENRWKPAQLIEGIDDCWNGTLKAHNATEVCSQRLSNGTIVGDEDCLTLDIITPHVRYDNPVPVIVLIGAESFTGGSPGALHPSASYARTQDVVFVRPNFRLGAFGFLAIDALTKDAYPRTSGNYALSDIIAVLNWVKLNIAHFGGDPKSVTLFGHRAGATLVSALVTSRKLKNLYSRAWVSSSSAVFPGRPLQESERRNQELMNAMQCADVSCLREASTQQLWDATPDTWLHFPVDIPKLEENTTARHEWLVLDGAILQKHPAEAWKEETAGKPRLVIGTTAHESHTEKLRQRNVNWTAQEVRDFIENSKIGALNLTEESIKLYNATNYKGLVAMITDIRTICPLLTNARLQPSVPFYVVTQGEGSDDLAKVNDDVQAILGRYEPQTAEQRRYVTSMQHLFYHYVAHGEIPQYVPTRRVIIVGQDALSQEDYPNCNFWISNDIVPRFGRID